MAAASLAIMELPAFARNVTATVYHPWYSGRTTACGQVYRHWGVSAAHPYLPCGTRVTLINGNRQITVPVNDRCDCDIDLSAGAAAKLGVPIDGIKRVKMIRN